MTSYVLTDGASTVIRYPYSAKQLKQDNKGVSFPAFLSTASLASWNVLPIVDVSAPNYDPLTQVLSEIDPTTSDGGITWTQAWEVTNLSSEGAQAFYDAAVAQVQAQVNSLQEQLKTYYTEAIIAGYGFTTEMLDYIAAISNPTALPGYPLISSWPVLPENRLDVTNPHLPVSIYTKQEVDDHLLPITQELSAVVSADLIAEFEQSLL